MSDSCIFCNILARKVPAPILAETEDVFVIKDIHPKAPIHYLIIPKKHVVDVQSLQGADIELMAKMAAMAQKLSQESSEHKDFRLVVNSGHAAGQRVFHLHMHYLAGGLHAEV